MKNSFKDALKETVEFMTLRSKLENNCVLNVLVFFFVFIILELCFHSSFKSGYLAGVPNPASLLTTRVCGWHYCPLQITLYIVLILYNFYSFLSSFYFYFSK